jgi:hypothetical protein
MIEHDARFYFANLASDVLRCVGAATRGEESKYRDSFIRAQKTLGFLRAAHRPEAYEEGLLLVRGLEFARAGGSLGIFSDYVNKLALEYTPLRA